MERPQMPLIMGMIRNSEVNGPGVRGVIHFQGCSLGCKGCFNPQSHSFNEKNQMSLNKIYDWIKSLEGVEGITFSGGEPMQQAPYLYVLATWIRENRPELSIGTYTGYSKKELENGTFKWKSAYDAEWVRGSKQLWMEIQKQLDFAIVGRYVDSMACSSEPLRGSRNQEVLFFTDRYKGAILEPQIAEAIIGEDGLVQITGYPTREFLDATRNQEPCPLVHSTVPSTKEEEDEDGLIGV